MTSKVGSAPGARAQRRGRPEPAALRPAARQPGDGRATPRPPTTPSGCCCGRAARRAGHRRGADRGRRGARRPPAGAGCCPLVVERLLDVPDPRHAVLLASPALFRAVRVRVRESPRDQHPARRPAHRQHPRGARLPAQRAARGRRAGRRRPRPARPARRPLPAARVARRQPARRGRRAGARAATPDGPAHAPLDERRRPWAARVAAHRPAGAARLGAVARGGWPTWSRRPSPSGTARRASSAPAPSRCGWCRRDLAEPRLPEGAVAAARRPRRAATCMEAAAALLLFALHPDEDEGALSRAPRPAARRRPDRAATSPTARARPRSGSTGCRPSSGGCWSSGGSRQRCTPRCRCCAGAS